MNKGAIEQYPYFAPDHGHLKPAPKATDADKLFLWMYTNTKANMDLARIDEEALPSKSKNSGFNAYADMSASKTRMQGSSSGTFHPRLKAERTKNGETLTQAVFGDTTPHTVKNVRKSLETRLLDEP